MGRLLQQQKFEVLFEIRARAKTDSCYWFISIPCHLNDRVSHV